jgi:hypothetical protein
LVNRVHSAALPLLPFDGHNKASGISAVSLDLVENDDFRHARSFRAGTFVQKIMPACIKTGSLTYHFVRALFQD